MVPGDSFPDGDGALIYTVITWRLTQDKPSKKRFADPHDALIAAVHYLQDGMQVRLSDRLCEALRELSDTPVTAARLATAVILNDELPEGDNPGRGAPRPGT